jgi:hypothetical protein
VPRRVAIFLVRALLLIAGFVLVGLNPRVASASGCHRGDRPTIGQFESLWIDATAIDPLIEPAALPEAAAEASRLVQRPCSTPAPRDAAPGHASLPACLDLRPPQLLVAETGMALLPCPLKPYEYQDVTGLPRPPRPPIDG